jgi:hypothetical protein
MSIIIKPKSEGIYNFNDFSEKKQLYCLFIEIFYILLHIEAE